MSLRNFILEKKEKQIRSIHKGIEIYVKDSLPDHINVKKVMDHLTSTVPIPLIRGVRKINIGRFPELENRKIQALWKNNEIFVTNKQDSQLDILDDIVHEVAHSVEDMYGDLIYSDGKVKKEFLLKRKQLWQQLRKNGFEEDISTFLNVKYDKMFDEYLYYQIGYPTLSVMTKNIFNSPYAATSLREYFANGFEAFFLKQQLPRLKRLCPSLFSKMGELTNVKNY